MKKFLSTVAVMALYACSFSPAHAAEEQARAEAQADHRGSSFSQVETYRGAAFSKCERLDGQIVVRPKRANLRNQAIVECRAHLEGEHWANNVNAVRR